MQSGEAGSVTLKELTPLCHPAPGAVITTTIAVASVQAALARTGKPISALLPDLLHHLDSLARQVVSSADELDTHQRSLYLLDEAVRPQLADADLSSWTAVLRLLDGLPDDRDAASPEGKEHEQRGEPTWREAARAGQKAYEREVALVELLLQKFTPWPTLAAVPLGNIRWSTNTKLAKSIASLVRYAAHLTTSNNPVAPRPSHVQVAARLALVVAEARKGSNGYGRNQLDRALAKRRRYDEADAAAAANVAAQASADAQAAAAQAEAAAAAAAAAYAFAPAPLASPGPLLTRQSRMQILVRNSVPRAPAASPQKKRVELPAHFYKGQSGPAARKRPRPVGKKGDAEKENVRLGAPAGEPSAAAAVAGHAAGAKARLPKGAAQVADDEEDSSEEDGDEEDDAEDEGTVADKVKGAGAEASDVEMEDVNERSPSRAGWQAPSAAAKGKRCAVSPASTQAADLGTTVRPTEAVYDPRKPCRTSLDVQVDLERWIPSLSLDNLLRHPPPHLADRERVENGIPSRDEERAALLALPAAERADAFVVLQDACADILLHVGDLLANALADKRRVLGANELLRERLDNHGEKLPAVNYAGDYAIRRPRPTSTSGGAATPDEHERWTRCEPLADPGASGGSFDDEKSGEDDAEEDTDDDDAAEEDEAQGVSPGARRNSDGPGSQSEGSGEETDEGQAGTGESDAEGDGGEAEIERESGTEGDEVKSIHSTAAKPAPPSTSLAAPPVDSALYFSGARNRPSSTISDGRLRAFLCVLFRASPHAHKVPRMTLRDDEAAVLESPFAETIEDVPPAFSPRSLKRAVGRFLDEPEMTPPHTVWASLADDLDELTEEAEEVLEQAVADGADRIRDGNAGEEVRQGWEAVEKVVRSLLAREKGKARLVPLG